MRGHDPFVIETFGGLWARGDAESAPSDHFTEAINVQYFSSGVETRYPLDPFLFTSLGNYTRVYNYVTDKGQTLLALVAGGIIVHVVNGVSTQILFIPAMEDFGFVAIDGRAYITPFKSYTDINGMKYELGLQNEFVYVYQGDGTPARKAGGVAPSNGGLKPFLAYNSALTGKVDAGYHAFLVTYTLNSLPGPVHATLTLGHETFRVVRAPGLKQIQLANIPIDPLGVATTRYVYMTKAFSGENFFGSLTTSLYYLVVTLNNNTTTDALVNSSDDELVTQYVVGIDPAPSTGSLFVVNTEVDGFSDLGFHLVGVVYETDSGFLTAPGPEHFGGQTYANIKKSIGVLNIPISPNPAVKKRHLISTKAIPFYNGDQNGYQFFFIPNGTLNDNVTTSRTVNYYDSDLLDDASHLTDNFTEIPAGVNLNTYHSRMVIVGEYGSPDSLVTAGTHGKSGATVRSVQTDNRSVARLSAPGEPEAISKIDGLIIVPLDGNPLTNVQEFRDILYLFKKTRTFAYADNQEEPAAWEEQVIDQGMGTTVHGIAAVLDSGGVNIDFLLIADLSGLMIFNGTYARPELSWKIENFWRSFNRNELRSIQIVNDSLNNKIWMTLPSPLKNIVLHANYGDGLDAKNIKWAKWQFGTEMSGICLTETDKLIITSLNGIHTINPLKILRADTYYPDITVKIPNPIIRTALLGE